MKRREFIEIGIAAAVLGISAIGARIISDETPVSPLPPVQTPTPTPTQPPLKHYRRYNGCGMSQDIWKDATGKVVREEPWDSGSTPAPACGMSNPTEKAVTFIHHLLRHRRAA